jgi:hypothetical protein
VETDCVAGLLGLELVGLGSLALALARTSQPLPPCQQQEGKEEQEAGKVDRAGDRGRRVRIGQRHPIK